jgi:hypothetical protein
MNLSLSELYSLYESLSKNGYVSELDPIRELIIQKENILLVEDTSGTGGLSVSSSTPSAGGIAMADASISGMGGVYQSQPSTFPGSLNGTNWINGGGEEGSGDISVPYNPSGTNRMFQKIKSPMGKNHGAKTGKKSRIRGLDLKRIRSMKSSKPTQSGPRRVMNFDDFAKKDITTKVTRVKE